MELQFNTEVISCLDHVLRQNQNQELTQEVRLSDGMPDIGRVISGWMQPVVRSKEWRSDSVALSGGAMVWVLYAPEDGTQERWVDSWIPFQMKWDIPQTDADGFIRIICQPRFVDARVLSARKLMIRAGVRAMAEAMVPMKGIAYSAVEVPEDVQLLKNAYPIRLAREAGEKQFQIDEELTLPGSCPAAEKLVYYTVTPEITEQRVSSDKVIFRGNTNLHLMYRSEEGRLHSCDIQHPFSQLAQLDHTYSADAQTDVALNVTSLELDLEEEGNLRLKCGLVGQYLVDDRQMLELVEDAYSPMRPVELHKQELELPVILEKRQERIRMEQNLEQPGVNVVDTVLYPDDARQSVSGDRVNFELPGQGCVLGYDENGSLRGSSVRWEDHFSIDADEGSRVNGSVQGIVSPQTVSGSDGMTVRGEYGLDLLTTGSRGMPMVTGLDIGEIGESDGTKPSLVLCRAGNRTLWELAKASGSTVDAIRRVNKLDGEPERNRMLLIPVG